MDNGQLKIDGFEYAVNLKSDEMVEISDHDRFGMYNSPELNKHRKINHRYHIW